MPASHVTLADLASLALESLPRSRSSLHERAEREKWPWVSERVRGGTRRLYAVDALPAEVREELARRQHAEPSAELTALLSAGADDYAAASARAREVALQRCAALRSVRALVADGTLLSDARAEVAARTGIADRSLRRWEGEVRGLPESEWAARLLPEWRGAKRGATTMHPDALAYAIADFLSPSRPAIAAVHRRTCELSEQRGWGEIPTPSTLRRLIRSRVPRGTRILKREGLRAFEQTLAAQTRTKTHLRSMERVNGDGHKFDVLVAWPNRDGTTQIVRPILVAWHDIYSGKILAWRLDLTENVDAVRLAFGDMVRDHGIPDHVHVDNGHAWAGKAMTGQSKNRRRYGFDASEMAGIYVTFGVEAHFAKPYHGQSKPIERAFRDLCEDIARHPFVGGAYTGNAVHRKPEDYGTRAIPLAEFEPFVRRQIEAHNARTGRQAETCAGRSFDETFAAGYVAAKTRRATGEQIQWLLLATVGVRIRMDEAVVVVLGNRYTAPELVDHQGERVIVRYDPRDTQRGVWVFLESDPLRPLAHCECVAAVGFDSEEAARRTARAHKAAIKAERARAAAFDAVSVREIWQDEIAPKKKAASNVVRASFGRAVPGEVKAKERTRRAPELAAFEATLDEQLAAASSSSPRREPTADEMEAFEAALDAQLLAQK